MSARFYVCKSSSLLRKTPFTRWLSSKPISSSSSLLISKNNHPSSSSNLLTRVFISKPYHPPPKIPRNHVREFSGEAAAAECNFDEDYLKKEIWEITSEGFEAQGNVEIGKGPPLDAVKILADKLDAFREKLGYDNEIDYPDHLKKFEKQIDDLEYYGDMVVAFGEYVAAGGDCCWQPFHGNWWDLMGGCGENPEKDEEILASLQQMEIRSKMNRRLIEEFEYYRKSLNGKQ